MAREIILSDGDHREKFLVFSNGDYKFRGRIFSDFAELFIRLADLGWRCVAETAI